MKQIKDIFIIPKQTSEKVGERSRISIPDYANFYTDLLWNSLNLLTSNRRFTIKFARSWLAPLCSEIIHKLYLVL
jgi:hypothetical protein